VTAMNAVSSPVAGHVVDRTARVVGRLRLSTEDRAAVTRTQSLVEEALRLTTLPGEDQGRVYVFRRLVFPSLNLRTDSRQWIGRCSAHLLSITHQAVHAVDSQASAAPVVYFHTPQEPWRLFVTRLLRDEPLREWFWAQVIGARADISATDRLEQTLDRWRVQEPGWSAVARELLASLDPPAAMALVTRLSSSVAQRWLRGFGSPSPSAGDSIALSIRPQARELLSYVRSRVAAEDPRLQFLAVLAVLDTAPSMAQNAAVLTLAMRSLSKPFGQHEPIRDVRGRRRNTPAAIPARDQSRVKNVAPAAEMRTARASGDTTEAADVENRTEWAGLYFLLHVLRRLGVGEAIEAQPALATAHIAARTLLRVAAAIGIADEDPILGPLLEDIGDGPEIEPRFVTARERRRFNPALWERGVRCWCRRYARLSLAEILSRQGVVTTTATSIDISLPLSSVDVRIRRAGLDLDPGYVPWFGRVVHFHYRQDGDFERGTKWPA